MDELYRYDALNRLRASHRGDLKDGDHVAEHVLNQTWDLDATGNWCEFSNFDQTNADEALVQRRLHNQANEISAFDETVGHKWAAPAHDNNGNTISIPQVGDSTQSYTLAWDAWHRLVKVTKPDSVLAEYRSKVD